MKRTPIETELSLFPAGFHSILDGAQVFDSSCSQQAKVYYIEKEGGFFLKSAGAGMLETEAEMTRYFHSKGLAAEVLDYVRDQQDWLLTRRVPGEDCTHQQYTDDPKRLSQYMGFLLRQLHELDISGCPIDRTKRYVDTAIHNFHAGNYDRSLFPDNWGYRCAEDAFRVVQEFAPHLKADVLLHGDYCLPNVILDDWKFSGFIDLDAAGLGDRHIDLFWGAWSLGFNLKTDAYRDRFLDAYGRDRIDTEILNSIGAFEVFG